MRSLFLLSAAALLMNAGVSSAAPIGPNLLTNGSFENELNGWTLHDSLLEYVHDSSGLLGTPPDGNYYLFLQRNPPYSGWVSSVSQTTQPLEIGQEYQVSGYYKTWSNIPTLTATLRVGSVDVVTMPVESTEGQWVYVEGTFVAAAATPTFQIRITGTQSATLNIGIDGLAIHAVPEPAGLGILGGGGLMLMARRRREA